MSKPKHGYDWRILAHSDSGEKVELYSRPLAERSAEGKQVPLAPPDTCFDELVIADWFHLEQMSDSEWWMRIGDARVWVSLNKKGRPNVSIERGEYD